MQFVTPALMNEGKRTGGILGLLRRSAAGSLFYEAESLDGKTYLLWIEACRLRANHTFPCVLCHGEACYVFESLRKRGALEQQEAMVSLWKKVVTPETVREAYRVTQLSEEEFRTRYAAFHGRSDAPQRTAPEQPPKALSQEPTPEE